MSTKVISTLNKKNKKKKNPKECHGVLKIYKIGSNWFNFINSSIIFIKDFMSNMSWFAGIFKKMFFIVY